MWRFFKIRLLGDFLPLHLCKWVVSQKRREEDNCSKSFIRLANGYAYIECWRDQKRIKNEKKRGRKENVNNERHLHTRQKKNSNNNMCFVVRLKASLRYVDRFIDMIYQCCINMLVSGFKYLEKREEEVDKNWLGLTL